MSNWLVYSKKADFKEIGKKFGIDMLTARVLVNRDIVKDEEIENFLNPDIKRIHSPLFLPDAIRAMNHILKAIKNGEKIRIVGDYDIDGVCATYILYNGLKNMGASVDYCIPHRIKDGYGINMSIIDEAVSSEVSMIITCDNGISAIEELSYASKKGIKVIVTDHHDIKKKKDEAGNMVEILPEALAVVDPKRSDSKYPFKEICGAVVAWKIIKLLYDRFFPGEDRYLEFLEFAAIATIGDVVALKDENRTIVDFGLKKLKNTENIGLRSLMEVTGIINEEKINTYHIGFLLGPCINSGGRLESADIPMRLFLEEDSHEAYEKATYLHMLNRKRQDLTEEACNKAFKMADGEYKDDKVLLIYLADIHESIAGIVAGRLKERYYKPSFVVCDTVPLDDGTEVIKGSGRSIETYHMANRLADQDELLLKYGGHPLAAGFSLKKENLQAFREALNRDSRLSDKDMSKPVYIDSELPLYYIKKSLVDELEALSPFGIGNSRPIFVTGKLLIRDCRVLGKNRNVVKLRLESSDGYNMEGIIFMDGDEFIKERNGRDSLYIVYSPEINSFMGKETIQLVIKEYAF